MAVVLNVTQLAERLAEVLSALSRCAEVRTIRAQLPTGPRASLCRRRVAKPIAAKEATTKALGLTRVGFDWKQAEVVRAGRSERAANPIALSWSEIIETMSDQTSKIRSILQEHGRLSTDANTLTEETDLYQAGMTSHASVNVMLALEGTFDVEFPDHMLKRNVFNTIASISAALDELTA